MSSRRSSSFTLVRPFRVRLSILDLRTSQSSNTNETSTINLTSPRRLNSTNPLTLKLNEFLLEHSTKKTDSITLTDRDTHDREIIQRFLHANNEIEARKILSQMWKESRFCDLMLVVDGSEYLAHRIVLGRNSFNRKIDFSSSFVFQRHLVQNIGRKINTRMNLLDHLLLGRFFVNVVRILSPVLIFDIHHIKVFNLF
jgi:hypothetical protein